MRLKQNASSCHQTKYRIASMLWGLVGILFLLGFAIWRLGQHAYAALSYEFYLWHWILLVASCLFMLIFEGYKGFHLAFAPRVVKRAHFLATNSTPILARLFAPLFLMGYIFATRKRRLTSLILTCMIVGFIVAFRYIPQPLRGILDFAVCAGLVFGIFSLVYYLLRLIAGNVPTIASDIQLPNKPIMRDYNK